MSFLWLAMVASLLISPLAQAQMKDDSVTVALPTRTAYSAVLVFHPDDIAHRRDNPWGWLRESFAYGPEAAAGRIIAFSGEIWGVVRLTTGYLTERERKLRGQPWTFKYQVRHGRVFVGTEDSLPYVDQEPQPLFAKLLPKGGFELANGAYAVKIYPIRWEAEPGSMTSDGKRTVDALPEFVILFERLEDAHGIEAALTPVYFPPFEAGKPSPGSAPSASTWAQAQYEQPAEQDKSQPHVLMTVAPTSVVTGFTRTVVDVDNVLEAMKKVRVRGAPLVLAPDAREGALAIVSDSTRGYYWSSADPRVQVGLSCGRLVRIRTLRRDQGLKWAQVEAVSRRSSIVSASEISGLKQEIEEAALRSRAFRKRLLEGSWIHALLARELRELRAKSGKPDLLEAALAEREAALARNDGTFREGFYELDRVQSMTSAEALTTWLISMLDLPGQRGLELLALSDVERTVELRQLLASR